MRAWAFVWLAACGAPKPALAPAAPALAAIPGGKLLRGHGGGRPDEYPRHEVEVSPFLFDRTLVTVADYAAFVNETHWVTAAEKAGYGVGASEGMGDWEWERIPHATFRRPFWEKTPDHDSFLRPDAPVVMVSWDDAVAYCKHHDARLPTEAEWEIAMRAGAMESRYPWGEEPVHDGKWGLNFWQGTSHEHNDRLDGWVYVSPVKAYAPNRFGVYDPVGNVWQWTADWYSEKTYPETAALAEKGVVKDPKGPEAGDKRVLRGGSWWCGACTCEGNGLFYRGKSAPGAPFNNIGFRCARSQPPGTISGR